MSLHALMALLLLLYATASGCAQRLQPSVPEAAIAARATAAPAAVRFTDVTEAAGIDFKHTSGRSGRFYFPETVGSGCAFLDYNNDGRPDIFLVNSTRLPGYPGKGPFYSALYRNDGAGRFTDVTRESRLDIDCYGTGVAIADYDGDGDSDIYLTALGPNTLFRNNGDGTFTDVTKQAGVGDPRFSTSAVWFDTDRDGWLDLFVCNYCHWTPEINGICPDALGRVKMCGPSYYKGVPCTLYRNNGDGTFRDVTKEAGLYQPAGKALGVAVWDHDDDGWLDFVVARDKEPNSLYRNNGDGTFTDIAVPVGVAYSASGTVRNGMGVDTGDVTNDGREAILIGNIDTQGLGLYIPDEAGHYTDTADVAGLLEPSLPMSTFATLFLDYDGDGLKDCFAANGHVDENIHLGGGHVTFEENLLAFRNEGRGRFREVGSALGPIFREKRVWRGFAVGDYDRDGDPDLLVSACDGRPALLRNDGGNRNSWLQVSVLGAGHNRQGIGTRVTVITGGTRQTGWIRSGSSYCSQHELKAFFGLGSATKVDAVEVRFPGGARQRLIDLDAGRSIVVEERTGRIARTAPFAGH